MLIPLLPFSNYSIVTRQNYIYVIILRVTINKIFMFIMYKDN